MIKLMFTLQICVTVAKENLYIFKDSYITLIEKAGAAFPTQRKGLDINPQDTYN